MPNSTTRHITSTEEPKRQIDKFRDAARQLETDDDEKRFDERLGKIAKPPTTPIAERHIDRIKRQS